MDWGKDEKGEEERESTRSLERFPAACGEEDPHWGVPKPPAHPSVSISLVPSSSQPGPGRLLCSLMDFSPAHIQLSCSQGQQQLSGHVLATAVLPSGDWSQQLLVLLETVPPPLPPALSSCQVEHVSLEHPLSRHWEMPPDSTRSKMLTGIGGSLLGFVFLVLEIGFYLYKKLDILKE
ncbi:class II histocompatibility antigen, B-L beta chain-like [Poecile atricapillus]|uniref:class II histocompatibility antigen, B-L beta chain-like n=1 Tax=Poecile atricapillus TaxID=48891 RepID=UPI0027397E1C|nr:class II histocompatibility antigen, B-L beta chain-like [Poecile atricapillus]